MRTLLPHRIGILILALLMMVAGREANAGISIAIVASDPTFEAGAQSALMATGFFSSVTVIDATSSTPTLSQLTPYSAVLAYTNYTPSDPTALGNVLASYVNQGGGLELATYSFSSPFGIGGQIMTTGYSPLTNSGNGDVSGNLVATQPGNPIFSGVDLSSFTYFHNSNFAHPGLDAGATLLATDGAGVNMIAENAAHNIIGINLFPGSIGDNVGNSAFYQLLGNGLVELSSANSVPEPSSLMLTGLGLAGLVIKIHRGRKVPA